PRRSSTESESAGATRPRSRRVWPGSRADPRLGEWACPLPSRKRLLFCFGRRLAEQRLVRGRVALHGAAAGDVGGEPVAIGQERLAVRYELLDRRRALLELPEDLAAGGRAGARAELDQHVVVGVERDVAREVAERLRTERDAGEQELRPLHADALELRRERRVAPDAVELVDVELERLPRADQDRVVAVDDVQHGGLGEDRPEAREDGAVDVEIDLVGLDPLREDAVRAEAPGGQLVEVAREEVRDAGHPGVRRLGDDDVVGLVRREQDVARVVLEEVDARIAERTVVDVAEVLRRL